MEIEEQVVEVPVTKHVQVPMIQTVQKSVDVPQIEYEDQAGGSKGELNRLYLFWRGKKI